MDAFEDDIELITLYHHIPFRSDKFGHSTCAYSNPAFGQMFKMNAKTDADGKVSRIIATVYDSLEMMYGDCARSETSRGERALQIQEMQRRCTDGLPMRNTIYRQIVFCIDAYRTWIEVADANLYKEHVISRSGRTDHLVSRTLVLRTYKAHGAYDKGTGVDDSRT